jgi:hypothetical protein
VLKNLRGRLPELWLIWVGWKQAVPFLKKMNQKNVHAFRAGILQKPGTPGQKSFLVLFFKKERPPFA